MLDQGTSVPVHGAHAPEGARTALLDQLRIDRGASRPPAPRRRGLMMVVAGGIIVVVAVAGIAAWTMLGSEDAFVVETGRNRRCRTIR